MTRMRTGRGTMVALALLGALVGSAGPAAAQAGTDTRVWTLMSVRGRTGPASPWRWAADSLVGTKNGAGSLDLLRGQLTFTLDLTGRTGVGIGYAYGAAFGVNGTRREHRLLEQFRWRVGPGQRVALRSTLEERFTAGRDTLWRAGQQVRTTLPLAASGLSVVVSDEFSVRLGRAPGAIREFDNRAFLGIARTVAPRTHVEAGYMHVYARRASGTPASSRIFVVALAVSR